MVCPSYWPDLVTSSGISRCRNSDMVAQPVLYLRYQPTRLAPGMVTLHVRQCFGLDRE